MNLILKIICFSKLVHSNDSNSMSMYIFAESSLVHDIEVRKVQNYAPSKL